MPGAAGSAGCSSQHAGHSLNHKAVQKASLHRPAQPSPPNLVPPDAARDVPDP